MQHSPDVLLCRPLTRRGLMYLRTSTSPERINTFATLISPHSTTARYCCGTRTHITTHIAKFEMFNGS